MDVSGLWGPVEPGAEGPGWCQGAAKGSSAQSCGNPPEHGFGDAASRANGCVCMHGHT